MSDKLSTAYIKRTMDQRLGVSRRGVELTEDDYVEAVEQALDVWNQYRSRIEYKKLDSIVTSEAAPVSVAVDDAAFGVRAVYFLLPYADVASSLTIFELAEKLALTRLGVKDIALTRSAWENYRRVRGVEPSWHFNKEASPRTLVFYVPTGPYDVGYELLFPFTMASQIKKDRDSTFLKLVEGYSRRILVEIRGKFGGQVRSPGGGSFSLNADYQAQESSKLIEEVETALSASRTTMPVPMYR